jgi:flagellar basal body-associated protein FliL
MSAPAAPPAAAPATDTPKAGGGAFWKIIAVAFILAVIGGECLFAFIYVSSATDKMAKTDGPAADAEHAPAHDEHAKADDHGGHGGHGGGHGEKADKKGGHDKGHDKKPEAGGHGAAGDGPKEREVDLGQFSLTTLQPASNTTLLVDFHLFGTVTSENEAMATELIERHKHRVRDQVLTTVRSAEIADLTDPGLGLIKRQILEKTNRALGKPILQGVIFSDFLVVEQ